MKRLKAEDCERAPFLAPRERPSVFDLLVLPTTVLRVMNLVRSDMEQELAFGKCFSIIRRRWMRTCVARIGGATRLLSWNVLAE